MGLLHLLVLRAVFRNITVVMVDLDEERLRLAKALGAERVVRPGVEAEVAVATLTQNIGADAVFDTVGGSKHSPRALISRVPAAPLCSSRMRRRELPPVSTSTLSSRASGGSSPPTPARSRSSRRSSTFLSRKKLDPSPLVTHTMPLDDFDKGVALVVERKALKVLFTPSRGSIL